MPFDAAMSKLCRSVPGALGAVFVDHEGEAIQQVVFDPQLDAYDLKVAGAHVAPLIAHAMHPTQLHVLGAEGSVFIQVVTEAYAVVLLAAPGTHAFRARAALRTCAEEVRQHM